MAGKRRCRLHGGCSTGPRDWRPSVAAMVAGRKRYIEWRHAMGLKAPGGRLPSRRKLEDLRQLGLACANALIEQLTEITRDPAAMARLEERWRDRS